MIEVLENETECLSEPVIIPYSLENKERIFDLGQGIHANRAYIFRRRGGKVQSYTAIIRKMTRQMLAFFALAALQVGLILVSDVTTGKVLLALLMAFCGCSALFAVSASRKSYRETLQNYYERNPDEGGTLTFDSRGITERSDHGETLEFQWSEYEACVICPEAIVILFTRPILIICSYADEMEQAVRDVLEKTGKEQTVFEVGIKGKHK